MILVITTLQCLYFIMVPNEIKSRNIPSFTDQYLKKIYVNVKLH